MQWFMELIFNQNQCKSFFSYSTLDRNGIERDTDGGSILFAWKYMLTSVNSIWKIGKTVNSAVGGKLVFRKFQVYSSRTQGVKKIEAI